jgi:AraC-like DNA-binding protein
MKWDDESVKLSAGTCFVWAPGTAPRGIQDSDHRLRVFGCHFDFHNRESAPEFWRETQHAVLHDLTFFTDTARYCAACYTRGDALGQARSQHLLQQLLWQFRDEAGRMAPTHRDDLIMQIIRSIREDPGARWNVDDLASRAGLSPSQFTRRFAAAANASPAHFVVQTRLERAKNLLRETDMTVRSISDALGYHDVHFFCRQFKAFTGQTPGSLRQP